MAIRPRIRNAELAKELGVSKQLCSRAAQDGRLVNVSKSSSYKEYYLDCPKTQKFIRDVNTPDAIAKRARQKKIWDDRMSRGDKTPNQIKLELNARKNAEKEGDEVSKKKAPKKKVSKKKVTTKVEVEEIDNQSIKDNEQQTGARLTKYDKEVEKVDAQTRKINIDIARQIGTLVPRDQVDKVFGKLHAIALNYFFPIGDRLSSSIAGVFGITDVTKLTEVKDMIDKEITRGLTEFKKEAEKLARVDD